MPVAIAAFLFVSACSSTAVNMAEPRRVVGTASGVRVDAEIVDEVHAGGRVGITWQVRNDRPAPIAIADILPETTWDEETQTVTVGFGSEVPGTTILPRLMKIASGETRTFATSAVVRPRMNPKPLEARAGAATLLRLRVNFLTDIEPFARLIDITEKGIADAALADELFAAWVEKNEAVYTNAVPVSLAPVRREGGEVDARQRTPI